MPISIECPNCGEEVIELIKKSQHSSRSKYSGGVTYELVNKNCPECGFGDVKESLESKGYIITN